MCLSGSAGRCSLAALGLAGLWRRGCVSHCQKTSHRVISSACLSNTRKYKRHKSYKVYSIFLCGCCFRSIFDGANKATEVLTSGFSFDPSCCCQESQRDGSGIRRELGSFYKQAVTPVLCQHISCLTKLSRRLLPKEGGEGGAAGDTSIRPRWRMWIKLVC